MIRYMTLSRNKGLLQKLRKRLATCAHADAAFAHQPGAVCAVLTADCLPVLLCDEQGTVVAAAHAGWRGLCAGVIENTLRAMDRPPATLLAYLGPAIGPAAFEVGAGNPTARLGDWWRMLVHCVATAATTTSPATTTAGAPVAVTATR